jgi:hypothetical protein
LVKKFNAIDIGEDTLKWNKQREAANTLPSAADVLKEITTYVVDDFDFTPNILGYLVSAKCS